MRIKMRWNICFKIEFQNVIKVISHCVQLRAPMRFQMWFKMRWYAWLKMHFHCDFMCDFKCNSKCKLKCVLKYDFKSWSKWFHCDCTCDFKTTSNVIEHATYNVISKRIQSDSKTISHVSSMAIPRWYRMWFQSDFTMGFLAIPPHPQSSLSPAGRSYGLVWDRY